MEAFFIITAGLLLIGLAVIREFATGKASIRRPVSLNRWHSWVLLEAGLILITIGAYAAP